MHLFKYLKLTFPAIILLGFLCSSSESVEAEPRHDAANSNFGPVINPSIPDSYIFANEKIDLDDVNLFERLDRELTAMVYTHGNTLLTIKRANRYFPILEPILKQNGIHPDFLYLACIESYLNPVARSGAGAAGIWQFMPATAKQYGLEVSDEIDERYNIELETRAACQYFKNAYAKYGNWPSVAASYNGGTARITKELNAQLVDNALDLWLTEETMRYPLRMIAMKMIMEDPAAYGFQLSPDQLYQPQKFSSVEVSEPVPDWPAWAQQHGIDYATLREFNPWIRDKKLTNKSGKSYFVKIPAPESLKRSKLKTVTYNSDWVK